MAEALLRLGHLFGMPEYLEAAEETLAWAEPQSRYDLHDVTTTARSEGDHFVLNGTKTFQVGLRDVFNGHIILQVDPGARFALPDMPEGSNLGCFVRSRRCRPVLLRVP